MAKIPLPERGQPLDVTYIYEMVNAINQVASEAASTTKNVSIDTPVNGTQYSKSADVRMMGTYIPVVNGGSRTSGEETTVPITFGNFQFKFPPVIVLTPINFGKTIAGRDVTTVLTEVTTSSASAVVRFNSTGSELSVGLYAMIIGIPN